MGKYSFIVVFVFCSLPEFSMICYLFLINHLLVWFFAPLLTPYLLTMNES